jgi:uncharacterized protein (DUF1684 family)
MSLWQKARYIEPVYRVLVSALICLCVSACGPKEEDYPAKIAALRASKDESFRNEKDSPIPADKKKTLLPLAYFPIDESYAVPASLEPAAERTRIQVPTSTGKIRDIERVGTLKFTVKGQPLQLTAFLELDNPQANRLFVPFSDLTSGAETYPAGRYMELDPTPTGIYVVDFNIAYHPYCYYSPEYDCPYPPKENRLTIPIRAGERMQKADSSIP